MPPLDEESFEYGTASFPGRLGHTATRLRDGGGILLTGGSGLYTDYELVSDAAWVFDPQTDTFTEAESLGSPRMLHTAVVSPIGQVLLIGGYGSQAEGYIDPLRSVDIFDPNTLTVSSLSETPSGPMLGSGGARYGTEGVLICGGLILNNDNSVTHSEKCDLIGVEGALNDADSLEVGLIWPRMVSLDDDSVLLTGGYLGEPGETYNQSARIDATERVFLYSDGTWSEVASMINPRAQHAAVALPDGRVLVAGGTVDAGNYFLFYSADALACAEIYDPQTDEWTEIQSCDDDDGESSLPVRMARPSYDVDPNYGVLIAGGYDEDGHALSSAAYFVGQPDL
jgi:N-acetylneuraminic acid mutarotase